MNKKLNFLTIPNNREAILAEAPSAHGIYFFKRGDELLYIGKSVNIKARLLSHIENARLDSKESAIISNADKIEYILTDSEFKALLLESELIHKYKPKYNARWRDDKSYLYIKITIKEDYPKIFAVRRERDDKSLYFGPFPSLRSIEEMLKEIRKIFPFCTQKNLSKRSCFYAKIHLCNPCPNMISSLSDDDPAKPILKRVYRNNIRHIIKIFEGDTDAVLKGLYKQLKDATREQRYEEALILRNKIHRFEHLVHDRIFRSSVYEMYNESEKKIEDFIQVLQPYFPSLITLKRIECYDVSNLSRREATASMVVFTNGMADKSQYRRFKIRNQNLQSDMEMLDEVINRRFKNDWPLPDLLVVDGGRPQVKMLASVLDELKIQIPFIGIAKNPDRLVIQTSKLITVRLPPRSPGFNMIRAMRDESHRFAKKYHMFLRDKNLSQKLT